MMDWQPIETAPKDGSKFISAWRCGVSDWQNVSPDTYWWIREGKWISDSDGLIEPTHWMPLPDPPARTPEAIEETGRR